MKWYQEDSYDRPIEPVCVLEECPDQGLLETAGYVDTETLVGMLIQAGDNLAVYREAEFPGNGEVPEDAPANRMLDRLDAIRESRNLRKRIKEQLDGNIGRDNSVSGRSGSAGIEHVEPVASKPEERSADEGKLAKG